MNYIKYKKQYPHTLNKFLEWISSLNENEIETYSLSKRDWRLSFLHHLDFGAGLISYDTGQTICSYQVTNPDLSRFLKRNNLPDCDSYESDEDDFLDNCYEILELYFSKYEN